MATSTEPSCVLAEDRVEIHGELYHGIPCRVRIAGSEAAAREAWQVLVGIDAVFNVYRPDSELGRINATGPGRHHVSSGLAACLRVAAGIEALSDGAWSATMLPLVQLWRAASRDGHEPEPEALASRAALAHETWLLDGDHLELFVPDAAFDLGGIAKGFAVDQAVERLRALGIVDLLVQVGGETACCGVAEIGRRVHRVGIPHPDDPEGSWCAVLEDPGAGLCGSTSGDYRLGHAVAGIRRHHILDARTGRPVENGLASATCVFPGTGRNALADGLTTAITVLGPQALAALCRATGCAGSVLRRDAQRGMLATETADWEEYVAA